MKKTSVIQSMITGMGVGFPVTLTCMAAIGGFNPVIREFLTWAVASALCACFLFAVPERGVYGIPAILGLHCLCCASITVGAAMFCGYVQSLGQILVAILRYSLWCIWWFWAFFMAAPNGRRKSKPCIGEEVSCTEFGNTAGSKKRNRPDFAFWVRIITILTMSANSANASWVSSSVPKLVYPGKVTENRVKH